MTSAREDVSPARAGGSVAPRDRSIMPTIMGLRWWGALVLALVLTLVGVGVDIERAGALGVVFLVCYPAGCVLATVWARRGELFAPMVQPPLLLLVAIPAVVLVAGRLPASGGAVATALAVAGPFINGFPAMGVTTVICIALGVARIRLQPVDTDATRDAGARSGGAARGRDRADERGDERDRGGRERRGERPREPQRERAADRERAAAERERATERERAADQDRAAERERAAERQRAAEQERAAERGRATERAPERSRPDAAPRRSPGGGAGERSERERAKERDRRTKDQERDARGGRPGYRRGEGARDREALAKGTFDADAPERSAHDWPPPGAAADRERMREERLREERRDGPGDDRRRGRPEPPARPGPPPKPGQQPGPPPPGVHPMPRRPDDRRRG